MKKIKFTKMVATGNDFVVIDNKDSIFGSRLSTIAKRLCDRKFGIGADGLLVIERSKREDFKMRIFNPDGSEPEMCGNGSRCIALFAKIRRIAKKDMEIRTKAGRLSASVENESVKINMTEPHGMRLNMNLKIQGKSIIVHYINTGVPHVVYFVNNIEKVDICKIGSAIRFHREFSPEGTNVNIVQKRSNSSIFVRTYERGVEEETLACGTGSVASGIIASFIEEYRSPVKVCTKGGDLKIYFNKKGKKVTDVFLEGQAKEVFNGEINI